MGTLERELKIFSEILNNHEVVSKTGLVTYGCIQSEKQLAPRGWPLIGHSLQKTDFRCRLNYFFLLRNVLGYIDSVPKKTVIVLRTNQFSALYLAGIVKVFRWRRCKLILRMGYDPLLNSRYDPSHSHLYKFRLWIAYKMFKPVVDCSIVTSQSMKSHLKSLKYRNIHVIPNWTPIKSEAVLNFEDHRSGIIWIGRDSDEKRLDLFIEAVRLLKEPIFIVGWISEERKEQIRKRFTSNIDRVNFMGQLEHDKVIKLLQRTSVLVSTSRFEGYPKVVIEAMANGCVCVATNVPGLNDLIEDGQTGILICQRSASIAEALGFICEDVQRRAILAKNAWQFVNRNNSIGHVVDSEVAVLLTLERKN